MQRWFRRVRAAIGMALTWALAWSVAGFAFVLIVGRGAGDVPFPIVFGMFGFVAGATFSGLLGLVDGRRRFDQMSLPRFAGWGALGGLLLSGILALTAGPGAGPAGGMLVLGPLLALAGGGSAAGTLALARRAQDPEWVASDEDVAEAGLTESERRELLGDGAHGSTEG